MSDTTGRHALPAEMSDYWTHGPGSRPLAERRVRAGTALHADILRGLTAQRMSLQHDIAWCVSGDADAARKAKLTPRLAELSAFIDEVTDADILLD